MSLGNLRARLDVRIFIDTIGSNTFYYALWKNYERLAVFGGTIFEVAECSF